MFDGDACLDLVLILGQNRSVEFCLFAELYDFSWVGLAKRAADVVGRYEVIHAFVAENAMSTRAPYCLSLRVHADYALFYLQLTCAGRFILLEEPVG